MQYNSAPYEAAAAEAAFHGWGRIKTRMVANIGFVADAVALEVAKNAKAAMIQCFLGAAA